MTNIMVVQGIVLNFQELLQLIKLKFPDIFQKYQIYSEKQLSNDFKRFTTFTMKKFPKLFDSVVTTCGNYNITDPMFAVENGFPNLAMNYYKYKLTGYNEDEHLEIFKNFLLHNTINIGIYPMMHQSRWPKIKELYPEDVKVLGGMSLFTHNSSHKQFILGKCICKPKESIDGYKLVFRETTVDIPDIFSDKSIETYIVRY